MTLSIWSVLPSIIQIHSDNSCFPMSVHPRVQAVMCMLFAFNNYKIWTSYLQLVSHPMCHSTCKIIIRGPWEFTTNPQLHPTPHRLHSLHGAESCKPPNEGCLHESSGFDSIKTLGRWHSPRGFREGVLVQMYAYDIVVLLVQVCSPDSLAHCTLSASGGL